VAVGELVSVAVAELVSPKRPPSDAPIVMVPRVHRMDRNTRVAGALLLQRQSSSASPLDIGIASTRTLLPPAASSAGAIDV
jgi:hypothetical protein